MSLQQFSDSEVKLSQLEAFRVLRFFWVEPGLPPGSLTIRDCAFAQALLVEAIDASYEMGYVKIIFDTFFMKLPSSYDAVKDMIKSFAKAAAKHWFKHATGKDLEDPKIYETVRSRLALNFRSVWQIRRATGDLTY